MSPQVFCKICGKIIEASLDESYEKECEACEEQMTICRDLVAMNSSDVYWEIKERFGSAIQSGSMKSLGTSPYLMLALFEFIEENGVPERGDS